MWSNLAPSVEANRIQDETDGYEQLANLEQEDLDAESTIHQQSSGSLITELRAQYQSEAIKEEITPEEYRRMMRQLNRKQLNFTEIGARRLLLL